VILLDASDEPETTYATLVAELEQYGQGLSEKPRVVALNKIDLPGAADGRVPSFGGERVVRASAVRGDGLGELVGLLNRMLRETD
jgi:GTP-binding protein